MQSNLDVIHAYRHLYRGLLKAVQYATPARYVARDQIRAAFRESPIGTSTSSPVALDTEGIKRTKWFLDAAAKERGLEHKILKNLIQVRVAQMKGNRAWKRHLHESKLKTDMKEKKSTAMQHYDMTVAMLNKTMGLCLR
ncbi:hypothetical protein Golomagni_06745 [Golovinomyces magnicellulatus]|nr:hypothetical protein Golomagni_06745 [Golovinomyces magnicellulatus]